MDFEDFAARRWPSLVRAAVFLGCSLPDAQDMAQNALLKTYLKWDRVSTARDVDAYVYTVLVNCVRDAGRRSWRREVPTDRMPEAIVSEAPTGVVVSIHRALAGLSRANRDVVVLRHFVDLSERQTADVLGISEAAVKSRAKRGLDQLALDPNLTGLTSGENR